MIRAKRSARFCPIKRLSNFFMRIPVEAIFLWSCGLLQKPSTPVQLIYRIGVLEHSYFYRNDFGTKYSGVDESAFLVSAFTELLA